MLGRYLRLWRRNHNLLSLVGTAAAAAAATTAVAATAAWDSIGAANSEMRLNVRMGIDEACAEDLCAVNVARRARNEALRRGSGDAAALPIAIQVGKARGVWLGQV